MKEGRNERRKMRYLCVYIYSIYIYIYIYSMEERRKENEARKKEGRKDRR